MVNHIKINVASDDIRYDTFRAAIQQSIAPICPAIDIGVIGREFWHGSRIEITVSGGESFTHVLDTYRTVAQLVIDAMLIAGDPLSRFVSESWYIAGEHRPCEIQGGFDPLPESWL